MFSQKFFICWWNRPTYTTSNTQTDKPGLAAKCLRLCCHSNQHMGYIDSSDHMMSSPSSEPQNCFATFWNSTHSWILLFSCGAKYTHQDFRLLLVSNLIEEAGKSQDCPTPRLVGRPSAAATNVVRLESRHNQHWPTKSFTQLCCHLCSSHGQRKGTVHKHATCDVGLSVVPCFVEHHTQ